MHHLLAYLSIATALVAPQTRRQTPSTRRASSLEKFADMAKKGQERLYQYQEELFEKYPDKIGRPTPPPKKAKKLKKESTVADVMAKYGAAAAREAVVEAATAPTVVVKRKSRGRIVLACGAALALFLTPGFLEYLISVRTKTFALEKSAEALVLAVAAPATDAVRAVRRRVAAKIELVAAGVREPKAPSPVKRTAPWRCPACGRTNEPEQMSCTVCQRSAPDGPVVDPALVKSIGAMKRRSDAKATEIQGLMADTEGFLKKLRDRNA